MAVCAYEKIIKYRVAACCTQPLHIGNAMGSKEEVLIHPADDLPFIQASSIAGACRDYFSKEYGEEAARQLFGTGETGCGSRICFTDGIFSGDRPVLELRPRLRIDRRTGSCSRSTIKGTVQQSGQKFQVEYIGAGAEFVCYIYLYEESMVHETEQMLAAVHQGLVQFGGLKSSGCGFLKLQALGKKVFTMTQAQDRRAWAAEDELPAEAYEDILSGLRTDTRRGQAYEIFVSGQTEGSMLVKSIAIANAGGKTSFCTNLKNAAQEYIVPGSSFKGALRNQMEKIADYMGRQELITDTFGYTKDLTGDGKSGNIVFYDTVVGKREENERMELSNRIHIDKFTGGVMDGGLFQEKNIAGELEFHISVKDQNDPDSTCGLLLLALRDLAIGLVNIGSGYAVGKGMITVERIVIKDEKHQTEAMVTFKDAGSITDGHGLIARCLQAVYGKEKAV